MSIKAQLVRYQNRAIIAQTSTLNQVGRAIRRGAGKIINFAPISFPDPLSRAAVIGNINLPPRLEKKEFTPLLVMAMKNTGATDPSAPAAGTTVARRKTQGHGTGYKAVMAAFSSLGLGGALLGANWWVFGGVSGATVGFPTVLVSAVIFTVGLIGLLKKGKASPRPTKAAPPKTPAARTETTLTPAAAAKSEMAKNILSADLKMLPIYLKAILSGDWKPAGTEELTEVMGAMSKRQSFLMASAAALIEGSEENQCAALITKIIANQVTKSGKASPAEPQPTPPAAEPAAITAADLLAALERLENDAGTKPKGS